MNVLARSRLIWVSVIVAGGVVGLGLRLAFNPAVRLALASELTPSDPRYKGVMCGPASLSDALGLLGVSRSVSEVASRCSVTPQGVALSDLERFANSAGGVTARSKMLAWDAFVQLEGVAVLFIDGNHFVVADPRQSSQSTRTSDKIRIYEQEMPSRWMSRGELEKRWDGSALVITKAASADFGSGPRIEFDKCFVDQGVLKGSAADYQFLLRNVGRSELSINKIKLSCGCASHILSSDRVGPGGSAVLKVTVKLAGKEGYMQQTAILETNDVENPTALLRMAGGVPKTRIVSATQLH